MTTKTMMQLAWDNWHADMAPDDIPGINPSFKEGWERCAELHAGIDMDKINDDLIDYREQIERLQYEVDAIPEIKAERDEWKARCEFSFGQREKLTAERDALKDAARLALGALTTAHINVNDDMLADEIQQVIAALKAVL